MKLLFVGAEALPFASTGGLADVLGSLPAALKRDQGEDLDIRVVLPLYQSISEKYRDKMEKVTEYYVQLSWRNQYCGLYSYELNDVTYYFIDNQYYFSRGNLYGNFDDGERFAFFCMAVMEMMPKIGFFPDVLHAHDWQSALSIIYLRTKYNWMQEYRGIKTVYTIHNIAYQGIYSPEILWDVFGIWDRDRHVLDYGGSVNLTKGAVVCADKVTTVSPTYAEEILTEHFSHGLCHILRDNSHKLSGIVNGIDYDEFNPATDKALPFHYDAETFVEGKAAIKAALQQEVGLPVKPDVPLMVMVTRLAGHKGLDLLCYIARRLMWEEDAQLLILGTGEAQYETFFKDLAVQFPEQVAAKITFNLGLADRIYAGGDIYLMPSKSEPCGLSQMNAMRYGTVPVVHATGGLKDTVPGADENGNGGLGFTFQSYNGEDFLSAVERCLNLYNNDREGFRALQYRDMTQDFSWDKPAARYMELFHHMCNQ